VPLDELAGNPVARHRHIKEMRYLCLLLLVACGPKVRPDEPEPVTSPGKARSSRVPAGSPGRGVLIGEMCPQGAGGSPAIAPLVVRSVGWSAETDDVADALDSAAHTFTVLGVDGTRAGSFEVLGAADVGLDTDVAIGSYNGRNACVPASKDGGAPADVACTKATGGCGVAIALTDPANRDEGAPDLETGTACAAGDSLRVDLDGDGAPESFPVAAFIDGGRAPAGEVDAAPVASGTCDPRASLYGLTIVPEPDDPAAPDDPRYHVVLDVLAIVDVDGDGRDELIVQYRYPESRTIAVYSAQHLAGRLELVGEAVPWQ
jgi:hypothetical protein